MKKSISLAKEQDEAVIRITARYVEQAQSGLKPRLSDYLVRYPDYKDALVDFVAYYHALEEYTVPGTNAPVSSEVLSEVSQLALEYVWQHICLSGEDRLHQLTTLLIKRDRHPFSLSYLAQELDLSVDVVVQLEQRLIDPMSIPLELSRHLAKLLQQPLYAIQAYFTENSQNDVPVKSESLQQRIAEQQESYSILTRGAQLLSFRQALTNSTQMLDQQKDRWCKIIEQENI